MIDRAHFKQMKRGVFLINTSSGQVVQEEALVEALSSGIVGGAGLDVFADEPRISPGLLSNPKYVVAAICVIVSSFCRTNCSQGL